jgi:ABC-type uncharacterized transport system permease subunit
MDHLSGADHYDIDTRTITTNPRLGLRVKSSGAILSAAVGTGHEISHAAEHDRIGTEAIDEALGAPMISQTEMPDGGMSYTFGVSPEEKRATLVEGKIATELGEVPRKNYTDEAGNVPTCGPVSRKEC